jgi:hypothetical protein
MKMYSVKAELIHADEQTHRRNDRRGERERERERHDEAKSSFSQFWEESCFFFFFRADISWKFSDVLILRKACGTRH